MNRPEAISTGNEHLYCKPCAQGVSIGRGNPEPVSSMGSFLKFPAPYNAARRPEKEWYGVPLAALIPDTPRCKASSCSSGLATPKRVKSETQGGRDRERNLGSSQLSSRSNCRVRAEVAGRKGLKQASKLLVSRVLLL